VETGGDRTRYPFRLALQPNTYDAFDRHQWLVSIGIYIRAHPGHMLPTVINTSNFISANDGDKRCSIKIGEEGAKLGQ
jgi:hypothetical protein